MTKQTTMSEAETFVRCSLDEPRWQHTLGVKEVSEELSEAYDLDETGLLTAALFHDNARDLPEEKQRTLARSFRGDLDEIEREIPGLWHAPAGAQRMVDEFNLAPSDERVQAVAFHTTATPEFTPCLKGLLVADFCEPSRSFPEASEVRSRLGKAPLDDLVRDVLARKLIRTLHDRGKIHPRSLRAYNQLCD